MHVTSKVNKKLPESLDLSPALLETVVYYDYIMIYICINCIAVLSLCTYCTHLLQLGHAY